MNKIVTLFILFILSRVHAANIESSELSSFLDKIYKPITTNILDLYVEIADENLTKKLSEKQVYGKLNDVYVKSYFQHDKDWSSEVVGLGDGFAELKEMIVASLFYANYFVFNLALDETFSGYKLKQKDNKNGTVFSGIDISQKKEFNEITIQMDNRKRLESWTAYDVRGKIITKYEWTNEDWCNGKFLLKKIIIDKTMKQVTSKSTFEIFYKYFAEIKSGLPIKIEYSEETLNTSDKTKVEAKKEIFLRNYKINEKIASKFNKQQKHIK